MDEMTQKNAALVEETTAAAHAMSGQAKDLKSLVGFFRSRGERFGLHPRARQYSNVNGEMDKANSE
jgi:methyl-accepting chemotaxis protein